MAPIPHRSASTLPASWQETLARPPRWLPWLVLAVVVAALGAAVVDITRAWRYQPTAAAVAAPAPATDYAERIAIAAWFGAPAAVESTAAQPLTDSTLGLTLRAVFVGSEGGAASAMVETVDGRTEVVRLGAELAPGATLQEVRADRIVLLRNGRREQLHFPTGGEQPVLADARSEPPAATSAAAAAGMTEEQKRANILRRLEELRARGAG